MLGNFFETKHFGSRYLPHTPKFLGSGDALPLPDVPAETRQPGTKVDQERWRQSEKYAAKE